MLYFLLVSWSISFNSLSAVVCLRVMFHAPVTETVTEGWRKSKSWKTRVVTRVIPQKAWRVAVCNIWTWLIWIVVDWVTVAFYNASLFEYSSTRVVYKHCELDVTWLVPTETAAVLGFVLCTPCNYARVHSVTSCKATYVGCMAVCLAATCQLCFRQCNMLNKFLIKRIIFQRKTYT